ncbi:hypothetical protein [Thalassospira alkalitolerans]|uniref:hypothetical protein n=1 Tax=Thalassospira alkalitolerans TaxID=1293890 RepID=UPI003AA7BEB2
MLTLLRDLFWPVLEDWDSNELAEIRNSNGDEVAEILSANFEGELTILVEESRRMYDGEEERRRTAEAKATNLLIVAGALVPLLTYLMSNVQSLVIKSTVTYWIMPLIIISGSYLVAVGFWSLRCIRVGGFHKIYTTDLVSLWNSEGNVASSLAKKILKSVRLNQCLINDKISALKMAHAFLFRLVISLGVLLISQFLIEFYSNIVF